jgi:hypothetical protein
MAVNISAGHSFGVVGFAARVGIVIGMGVSTIGLEA